MTYRLGLTGSIGMGKSTSAKMFADAGCAVWDADAAVHRLYGRGGDAVAPVGAEFPDVVVDGEVARDRLRKAIAGSPDALARLEGIVHPLVREDRDRFAVGTDADICVFDIPLLFETGAEDEMDGIACVSVSRETQRERVLARGTMTAEDLDRILARQMPNEEKCRRATWVIETETLDRAKVQVHNILREIRESLPDNA